MNKSVTWVTKIKAPRRSGDHLPTLRIQSLGDCCRSLLGATSRMISFATKSLVACAGTLLLASTALTQQTAEARSVSYELNIPAENLDAALQALALASHHKLLYRAELVAGKASKALVGTYTTEEAVRQLLEGTTLSFEITPASVVLIKGLDEKTATITSTTGSPQTGSPPTASSDDPTTNKEAGKKSSQDFRVAQVDQGRTSSDVPVEKKEKEKKKKTRVSL